MKVTGLFFFIVFLARTFFCHAQSDEALLNTQLSSFEVKFKDLMTERGLTYYSYGQVDAEKLRMALERYNDASIMFYHYEGGQLWTWLISRERIISSNTATTPAELVQLERDMKMLIGVQTQGANAKLVAARGAEVDNTDKQSNVHMEALQKRLCEILLPSSMASAIANTASIKYLIVVPELNIATIPFYFLQPFHDSSYVVDHASISFAHSFNDLLNRIYYYCEKQKWCDNNAMKGSFTPENPLVVGNPDLSGCANVFQQLAEAGKEADYAALQLNTTAFKGKEANKKNVIARVLGSEFLYFATHGMASGEDPLNSSYLVLAGSSGCDHWTAKEIQSDTLQPEAIVVLSACQTGLGKAVDGGMIGLSRAFMKAGAMVVVMSLWSVRDDATRELMSEFMDELKQPHVFFPADNLRQAIVNYKKKNPDPAAWACFTMMGTPYPAAMKINLKS